MNMAQARASENLQRLIRYIHNLDSTKTQTCCNLRRLADEMQQEEEDLRIKKRNATTAGIAGTGVAVTGLLLAPVTFGLSTALTLGGGVFAGAGLVAGAAALRREKLMKNTTMKKVEEQADHYKSTLTDLIEFIKESQDENLITHMITEFPNLNAREDIRKAIFLIIYSIKKGLDSKTEHDFHADSLLMAVGEITLAILTIPFQIHTFVDSIVKLYNDEPSKSAEAIRDVAASVENHRIVNYNEDTEAVRILRGDYSEDTGDYEEYRRRVERFCEGDKAMVSAVLSFRQQKNR